MSRRWHPIFSGADPASGWIGEAQLAELRQAEVFKRAMARRDRFEAAVACLDNPSPEEVRGLWDQIDKEMHRETH